MGGVYTKNNNISIKSCIFRNLYTYAVNMGTSIFASDITIDSCEFKNISTITTYINTSDTYSTPTINNCKTDGAKQLLNFGTDLKCSILNTDKWFGTWSSDASYSYMVLPTDFSTQYLISLSTNTAPSGHFGYRQTMSKVLDKQIAYDGSIIASISLIDVATSPTLAFPSAINFKYGIGTLPADFGVYTSTVYGASNYMPVVIGIPIGYAYTSLKIDFLNTNKG
jgi:hypothetical protein